MEDTKPLNQNNSLPLAQRVILGNLLVIFLVAAGIVTVIIYRQQVQRKYLQLINEEFQISHTLSMLNKYHLLLQHLLIVNHEQMVATHAHAMVDYNILRTLIEQEAIALQKNYQTVQFEGSADQSIETYLDTWHTLDDLLYNTVQRPYDDEQLTILTDYLTDMEDIVSDLLQATQVDARDKHGQWNNNTSFIDAMLFGIMVVFLVLVAWTLYGFWRFARKYQAIANELQASERRHRTLLETIPDVVLRRTRAGIYTDYKPAKTFGQFMTSSQFIGKHVREILPPDIAQQSLDIANKALATETEQTFEYRMANRITGVLTDYEARVLPSGKDEVQVIIRDITQEKVQQEWQQQAQKSESLGILAGGIAHDFNNLLTSIMAQIGLAKAKMNRNKLPYEQLDKTLIAAERAADLTRQLLAYAGKSNFQVVALDLNQLIHDNISLLETALPLRAELQMMLDENLPLLRADRGQIQQIVMNIAINAAEALRYKTSQGDRSPGPPPLQITDELPPFQQQAIVGNTQWIRIVTAVEQITEQSGLRYVWGSEYQPGKYIVLQVQDNGIGMEETVLQHIFDPFYSTKEQGHGLGLAATLGIVRRYDGCIQVESELGVGTTFRILFPAADETLHVEPVAQEHKPYQYAVTPTILIVDDETGVRDAVVDILEAEGFTTIQAADGEAGITQLRQHEGEIDLVVLDMKMPGLSGDETLRIMHEIEPTLKVILSSGYTESEVDVYLNNAEIAAFLPKPFTVNTLVTTVHQILINPGGRK